MVLASRLPVGIVDRRIRCRFCHTALALDLLHLVEVRLKVSGQRPTLDAMKRSPILVGVLAALLVSLLGVAPVAAVDGTEPVTTVAGSGGNGSNPDQLSLPQGVAAGGDGNLYIADTNNHRVQKIDTNGIVTTVAGSGGQGSNPNQLNRPHGVAVDGDGNLYIADFFNSRVQKVDANGIVTTVAGDNGYGSNPNQLSTPNGVAVDGDGNLYIADRANNRIQKVDTNGMATTVAGSGGQGSNPDQLSDPVGVAVDGDGNLYIADRFNSRIQKVDTAGMVTTVAGIGGDGSGNSQLASPHGVGADGNGSLYIADTGNARVQKLTAADITAPMVTITTPTTARTGDTLTAAFTCADEGTAGLTSCTATLNGNTIMNGDAINTTSPGTATLIATGIDGSNNTTAETITITITAPEPVVGSRELTGTYAGMSGIEGSIARLYMAVFNRQPDAGGHAYWVNRANNDLALRDTARFFINSPEFVDTYSTLDNPAFVDLLYLNVMDRVGDSSGVRFWNEQLDNGMDRSVVVLQFSESPEFKALTGTT